MGRFSIAGVDVEAELSRPYAYISGFADNPGFYIVELGDPAKPKIIYRWHAPTSENDKGLAGENGRYFKLDNRYYFSPCGMRMG